MDPYLVSRIFERFSCRFVYISRRTIALISQFTDKQLLFFQCIRLLFDGAFLACLYEFRDKHFFFFKLIKNQNEHRNVVLLP